MRDWTAFGGGNKTEAAAKAKLQELHSFVSYTRKQLLRRAPDKFETLKVAVRFDIGLSPDGRFFVHEVTRWTGADFYASYPGISIPYDRASRLVGKKFAVEYGSVLEEADEEADEDEDEDEDEDVDEDDESEDDQEDDNEEEEDADDDDDDDDDDEEEAEEQEQVRVQVQGKGKGKAKAKGKGKARWVDDESDDEDAGDQHEPDGNNSASDQDDMSMHDRESVSADESEGDDSVFGILQDDREAEPMELDDEITPSEKRKRRS
ncbi:hypothetical protein NM208_g5938 [Fusarium decemcellulare]|uniref:Uncharacterized protein n=1 Tax=Fusarium decemcellulare TaxID=57161 RepID=A0ACC1SF52_9HYPO|nr:hypothetical protein NM208_g5938 [Fusarium decemcellulare]